MVVYILTQGYQERITVHDGRNIAPNPRDWVLNHDASEARRQLGDISRDLLGFSPDQVGGPPYTVKIQVDRFKGEWLVWRHGMTISAFERDILWKIDNPVINIYPHNWV